MKRHLTIIGTAVAILILLHSCMSNTPGTDETTPAQITEKGIREISTDEQDSVSHIPDSFADVRRPDMEVKVTKGSALLLETEGFQLTAVDTAVRHAGVYSVTSLETDDLAPLPQGMKNMTAVAAGYRLLPGGEHFSPYAEVRVAYDPSRLPLGYTPKDIYTSYYDTVSLAWVRLERIEVDTVNREIVSATTHFTDFINELLKSPEMPETQAFVPTQMSGLEAANPLDGLTLIQPPTANNMGTANLTYPIIIPAGRGGMQPNLSLVYSSTGGSGWLGVGWDIPVPAITLDTRWGVPRYDTTYETEIYMLNGEQLLAKDTDGEILPMPHRTNEQIHRASLLDDSNRVQFLARTGDAHDSIIRHGDSPKNYWWEVIDRYGTTHYYGLYHDTNRCRPELHSTLSDTLISTLFDTNTIIYDSTHRPFIINSIIDHSIPIWRPYPAALYDDNHNIARWMLAESRDLYGNTVRYYYDKATVRNRGAVGRQIYLDSISYTGYEENDGYYTVVFCRTGNNTPDIPVSCSNGFKEITDQLLNNVYLKCGDSIQTIWHFETENGDSTNYKNRLVSVTKIDSVGDYTMRQFLDTICHCLQQDEDDYGTAPHIYKPRNNNEQDNNPFILNTRYVLSKDTIPHYISYYFNDNDKITDTTYTYSYHLDTIWDTIWVIMLDTIPMHKLSLKEILERDSLKYAGTTTAFEYNNAPKSDSLFGPEKMVSLNSNGVRGFLVSNPLYPQLNILNQATALGLSTSSSRSVGGTVAVGLGSVVCLTNSSVGGNYTRSESSSESLLTLIDLDGDGLSDKVYIKGKKMFFSRQIPIGDDFEFAFPIEIDDVSHFMEESSQSTSFGAQVDLGLSASANWTDSRSTISTYFADVNGDGLIDLVNNGQVLFNHRGENGGPVFSRYSDPVQPQSGEGDAGYVYGATSDSSCRDIIFDGAVDSNVNCRRVWVLVDTFLISMSDTVYYTWLKDHVVDSLIVLSTCSHKVGDSLKVEVYRREWDCSYHDASPNSDAVRVWVAPKNGPITITSVVRLLTDSTESRKASRHADGVVLSIQQDSGVVVSADRFTAGETKWLWSDELCDTCYYDFEADTGPQISYNHTLSVDSGDLIFFRLRSKANRNFDKVSARFTIDYDSSEYSDLERNKWHFDSHEDFVLSSDLYFQAPVDGKCIIENLLLNNNEGALLKIEYNDSSIQPHTDTGIWFDQTISKSDSIRVVLSSSNSNIKWGNVICKPHIVFIPNTDSVLQNTADSVTVRITDTTKGYLTPLVDIVHDYNIYSTPLYRRLFGPINKGWGQFAYRSEGVDADTIKIKKLIPPDMMLYGSESIDDSISMSGMTNVNDLDTTLYGQSETMEDFQKKTKLYNPYSLQSAWVEMTPDAEHWAWVSFGRQNAIGRDTLSNSLLSEWFSSTPDTSDFENDTVAVVLPQAIIYDDPIPLPYQGTPAKAIRKVNSTKSRSWSAGFAQLGTTFSNGSNTIEMDYMDLNGDRYPDIIGTDKVQYSQQWGGIGPVTDLPSSLSHGSVSYTNSIGSSYSASKVISERATCGTQQNAFFILCGEGSKSIEAGGNLGFDKAGGSWVDMNGDGLPDFVYPNGSVHLNTGYGFLDDGQWDFNNVRNGISGAISFGLTVQDENDEFIYEPDNVTNVYQGSIKAGFGVNGSYNHTTHMLMDINGDGLPDKLWREINDIDSIVHGGDVIKTMVSYNQGVGMFSSPRELSIGRFHTSASFNESLDVGMTYGFTVWGFKATVGLSGCPYSGGVTQDYVQLADINGDGLPDWVNSYKESEMVVCYNQSGKTNLLKSVTNFTGSSIQLDYTLSEASYEHPSRGWLMTSVTTDDPLNPNGERISITEYSYDNPYYDRYERMSYGFDSVVIRQIDPITHNTLRFVEHGYNNHSLMQRGKLTRERIYDSVHNLYVEKLMHSTMVDYQSGYTVDDQRCPVIAYPLREGIYTHYYEGSGTKKLTTREVIVYDRYHNILYDTIIGDFTHHPNDGLVVKLTYYHNQPHNLIGLRESYSITSFGPDSVQRDAHFTYTDKGKLEKLTIGGDTMYKFNYDNYGNLALALLPENDNNERVKYKYTYDNIVHAYPELIYNVSYGETMRMTNYDYRIGKPRGVTDPGGNTMIYNYDFAGRLASVCSPMNISGTPSVLNEYHPVNYYHGNINPIGYIFHESISGHPYCLSRHYGDDGNLITQTVVLTDGFGRVLQTKKGLTEDGVEKMQVSGRTFVDSLGMAVRQSDPFTVLDTDISYLGRLDTLPTTAYLTHTSYDVLNRVKRVAQPLGITTRYFYDIANDANGHRRFYTRITDPNGNVTHQYADFEGRQVQVTADIGNGNVATTKMHYDNLGQLLWSQDPEGFTTYYGYDDFGRLKYRDHPDAGHTEYKYDPAGNLTLETNPLGEISYDYTFYRLQHKRYSSIDGMSGNNVTYIYGNSGNETGRISQIIDGSGSLSLKYDSLGNVISETRIIALPENNGEVYRFHMEYTYDSWGRMLNMQYPDGEMVEYTYLWGGDLLSMNGNNPYINEIRYNAFGQRDSIVYGNGTRAKYTYDALHRLKHLSSYTAGGIKMQDIDYTFDKASNIENIHNDVLPIGSFAGSYQNGYKYDNLNRLVFSSGDNVLGNYRMNAQYSPSGRIAHKYYNTPSGALSRPVDMYYGYCDQYQPHAVRRIYDHHEKGEFNKYYDFRWDKAGNLGQISIATADAHFDHGRFLFWTEDNRLHTAVDDKHYSYYVYDHSGERRVKLTGESELLDANADLMLTGSLLYKPTLYPSPYLVLSNKEYTKHYYSGADRVAACLGGGGLDLSLQKSDCHLTEPSASSSSSSYFDPVYPGEETGDDDGLPDCETLMSSMQKTANELFGQSRKQLDNRELERNDPDCLWKPENFWETEEYFRKELQRPIEGIPERLYVKEVYVKLDEFRENTEKLKKIHHDESDYIYYYHGDHLGSASWITDHHGLPVQHLQYLPYGEPYVDQRTSGYSERFRFTGKERDEETGYGYFGARYMDHELMTMWLSVDPMAYKYPNISPYAYCAWNPIKLVDPDGKESMETDIVNKKTGACKHIEDGKNQIILLSDQAYNTIEMMGQDSYTSMSESQQKEYNSLLNSGEAVSLNSKLGKTIRAVYAEMGSISCSEQDRNIVASSIATRLKTEPNIDKVLNPKQYNATGTEVYKIGPYEKEKQILQKNPYYYKAHSKAITQTRLQVISASYKALCGLLSPEYNNIHSFVSPPLSSTHFDSNKNLSNVTSSFSNLKGVSGVWRLK